MRACPGVVHWKPVFKSAAGIGESFFTKFTGLAGVALKGCFALNDSASKILMTKQMAESAGTPYITIFSSVDKGYINPYGVTVNTNGNIDAESVLQVFRVSNSDAIEVLLDSNNPLEIHELYNICFVKDDTLVQPDGKVMVQIPIPQGMKGNTCKVYRQETNGNWTILDARIQGNYLVFETDHFSLYALIGEGDNLVISSLPNKINYQDGEILDTNGLVIDLNGQLITEGYICEPTVLSGNGKQFVKVTYGHSVTEFEVNIEKETPTQKPDNQSTATPKPTTQPDTTQNPETTNTPLKGSIAIDRKNNVSYRVIVPGKTVEFYKVNNKKATKIVIPATGSINGVKYKVTAISDNAFNGCKKLKSVTIGKFVATIGNKAFFKCTSLKKITIPTGVTKIGKKVFYGCKKLKSITIKTKKLENKLVGTKAFKGIYTKANIKVPKPKLKSYKKILRAKGVGKRAKIHT